MRTRTGGARGARGLSLIEVMIATVLLAIAMLGIASSFHTAQTAQTLARERQAAATAALSQLQNVVEVASRATSDAQFTAVADDFGSGGFNNGYFHVIMTADTVDVASAAATAPAGAMTPAAAGADWPADRTGDALVHAGFTQVTSPRTGMLEVTVIVGWRSATGGNQTVSFRQLVLSPVL